MPTNKKKDDARTINSSSQVYDEAVKLYTSAMELLRTGDFAAARDRFHDVRKAATHEPELAERAATYARICERRLDSPVPAPDTPDESYRRAVLLSNQGDWDMAIMLLDRALAQDPTSVSCLYVRASAWALKGAADKAVADLRQAISLDPKVRFQAVNDPDFERIREEPSFIDIIEPTPTGA